MAFDTFGDFDSRLTSIERVIGTTLDDLMYGTNGAEAFEAGNGNDQIVAWDGADTIDGGAGNDVMLGWTGDDSIRGGDDNDWLWMGDGNDVGFGGDGIDVLVGDLPGSLESGTDLLVGGIGDDILIGGAANDTLYGGLQETSASSDAGSVLDWLIGGAGDDLMYGGGGNDVIWEQLDTNESGNDTAFGGDGNDLILTGIGNDTIDAGVGNDTVYGGAGADHITLGSGNDQFWFDAPSDTGNMIADFVSGQDVGVLYQVIAGSGLDTDQAFAGGVLALQASAADTLLIYDADGAGGSAGVTLATFLGMAPGSFNTGLDFDLSFSTACASVDRRNASSYPRGRYLITRIDHVVQLHSLAVQRRARDFSRLLPTLHGRGGCARR